ncbi:hypothetical protein ACFX11_042797 [Malus domestica]
MADGIIAMLLERLVSTVYEYVDREMKHVLNVAKEIDDFAAKLKGIQAVLEDAEQRQVKDASVRIWLDKLNDISYKMVDVLDTDILKQQVEHQEREGENVAPKKKMKKKVAFSVSPSCFCFRKAKEVTFRHEFARKIKDLNDKLSVTDEQRRNTLVFQLNQNGIQQVPKRQETSHYVDMSKVFGRENEKNVLITKLLSDGREDRRGIFIIPILGMGGMGKTTLTQLAYNLAKVQTYFDKRIWVCVSHPFDEIKIAKAISSDNPPTSNDQLSHVLDSMSTSIKGKRFLIVLDDVWTHDPEKWELLRIPLIQSGAKGSRILITTRQHDVVDKMEATRDMINLEELSENFCLSIFDHFSGRQVDEFEDISKEMVERCRDLPLAAKAFGSLMRNKRTMREWLDVLNSKIWDQEEVEQKVFQPLLLSYYDLAPTIKCCLLYCASFPKDYEFEKDNLINLWMAQDYLNSKGNKDKGEVDLKKDSVSGKIIGCKMHDIVHDFVQSLTKNECFIIDVEGVGSEIEVLDEKVRHLTVITAMNNCQIPPSDAYYNCKNFRTLINFGSPISVIDSNFISQLKCLRTLNLSKSGMSEVPKEIGELIHLRHLDLSLNGDLKILPDSICELYNLYTLCLCSCHFLEKLPDNIGKLISLKHLYVVGCYLEYLPKGIRRLKKLKTIDECVVVCGEEEDSEALQMGDLRVLNLEGRLTLKLNGDVKDEREIEKAQLWHMKKLFHLEINSDFVRYNKTLSMIEMMNALRAHENLESLVFWYYSGNTCPSWMMYLHNLRFISLHRWSECKFLPPLGKLPYLEKLTLWGMYKVKKVGGEFLGIVNKDETSLKSLSSSFFPKLKQLKIVFMDVLEEWEVGVEGWNNEDSVAMESDSLKHSSADSSLLGPVVFRGDLSTSPPSGDLSW